MEKQFLSRRTVGMLFGAQIIDPIVMREYSFEANPEYHEDGKSRVRGLSFMKKFASCFEMGVYLLVTDNKIYLNRLPQPVNRTFIHSPVLKELDRVEIEVDIGEAWPLTVAIIDIKEFDVDASELLLFGSGQSIYIFSELSAEALASRAVGWILSYKSSRISSFNYEAMINDLSAYDQIAFFRYSASHNRHYESMVVVGPGQYVDKQVVPCIEEACSDQNVIKYTDNFVPDN